MDTFNILAHGLTNAGFRKTPQRLAICRFLASSKDHPTAYEVYEHLLPEFPTLSLATVYNTLETLVNLGVVQELGSAGDDKVHYDADTAPHLNFACLSCNRIIDLESQTVKELDREVSFHSGYQVLGARLMYYGYCPDCARSTAGATT
jgi:Fur family transcriptional regulator, peroxide stress response regulator